MPCVWCFLVGLRLLLVRALPSECTLVIYTALALEITDIPTDHPWEKYQHIDPFTKRHKLVHDGGFPKFEVLHCSQNTVKSIKIQ